MAKKNNQTILIIILIVGAAIWISQGGTNPFSLPDDQLSSSVSLQTGEVATATAKYGTPVTQSIISLQEVASPGETITARIDVQSLSSTSCSRTFGSGRYLRVFIEKAGTNCILNSAGVVVCSAGEGDIIDTHHFEFNPWLSCTEPINLDITFNAPISLGAYDVSYEVIPCSFTNFESCKTLDSSTAIFEEVSQDSFAVQGDSISCPDPSSTNWLDVQRNSGDTGIIQKKVTTTYSLESSGCVSQDNTEYRTLCDDGYVIEGENGEPTSATSSPNFHTCVEDPNTCSTIQEPVCAENGLTYSNECELFNDGQSVDCQGQCPCSQPAVCGDGVVASPEQCDDGNIQNGDGCSDTCQIETQDEVILDGESGGSGVCVGGIIGRSVCHDQVNQNNKAGCLSYSFCTWIPEGSPAGCYGQSIHDCGQYSEQMCSADGREFECTWVDVSTEETPLECEPNTVTTWYFYKVAGPGEGGEIYKYDTTTWNKEGGLCVSESSSVFETRCEAGFVIRIADTQEVTTQTVMSGQQECVPSNQNTQTSNPEIVIVSPGNGAVVEISDVVVKFSTVDWNVGGKGSDHAHFHIDGHPDVGFDNHFMFYNGANKVVEFNLNSGETQYATWVSGTEVRFNDLPDGQYTVKAHLADSVHANTGVQDQISFTVDVPEQTTTCPDPTDSGWVKVFDADPTGNGRVEKKEIVEYEIVNNECIPQTPNENDNTLQYRTICDSGYEIRDPATGQTTGGTTSQGVKECVAVQGSCTTQQAPVCGTDGMTYSNSCFVDQANIPVDCQGQCPCTSQGNLQGPRIVPISLAGTPSFGNPGDEIIAWVQLENKGDQSGTTFVEAAVYGDTAFATLESGFATQAFLGVTGVEEINTCGVNEEFVGAVEVVQPIHPGTTKLVKIRFEIPDEDSEINGGVSNWEGFGEDYQLVAGTYLACGEDHVGTKVQSFKIPDENTDVTVEGEGLYDSIVNGIADTFNTDRTKAQFILAGIVIGILWFLRGNTKRIQNG